MHSLGAFKGLGAGLSFPTPAPLAVFLTRSLSRNDHVGDAPTVPEWGYEALPEAVERVRAPPRGRGRGWGRGRAKGRPSPARKEREEEPRE